MKFYNSGLFSTNDCITLCLKNNNKHKEISFNTISFPYHFSNTIWTLIPKKYLGYLKYIYRYYSVKFGVIPSGQENHSRAKHLNFPGRELNVIITEQYFLRKNQRPVNLGL